MGSDRMWESRDIAQNNFWPARALLIRTEAWVGKQKPDTEGVDLVLAIRELLRRTEQR